MKKITLILVLASLVIISITSGSLLKQVEGQVSGFSTPVQINNKQVWPPAQMVVSNNNVYFSWVDDSNPDKKNVFFSKSTDGGITFSSPITVANNIGTESVHGAGLKFASSGNNLFLVWYQYRFVGSTGYPQLYFAKSADGGITFSSPILFSNTTASMPQQILASGSNVTLIWKNMQDINSNWQTLSSTSLDSGTTFSNSVPFNGNLTNTNTCQSGNNVLKVWDNNGNTLFAKSSDGGNTFGNSYNIDKNGGSFSSQLICSGSNVFILWQSGNSILLAGSTDSGYSFHSPVTIGSGGSPQLVVYNNSLYLQWIDYTTGNIFFTRATGFPMTDKSFVLQPLGTVINLPLAQNQTTDTNEESSTSITLKAIPATQTYDYNTPYYNNPKITPTTSPSGANTYTYSIVNPPQFGTLTGTPPSMTYTPIKGYYNNDAVENFKFKANNGILDSNVATISIRVEPISHPPKANAGIDQTVTTGSKVMLNGTSSSDTDYDSFIKWIWNSSTPKPTIDQFIKYSWLQTAGPTVILSNKTIANPTFMAPAITSSTSLTFVLTVSKSNGMMTCCFGNGPFSDSSSVTITVKPSSISQPVQNTTNTTQLQNQTNHPLQNTTNQQTIPPQTTNIPSWVKGNAKYWHDGSLGDDEFEKGIKYMIDNKIIKTNQKTQANAGLKSIPKWIKSDAGWWADGTISQDEFLKGIEYLVQKGIINIQ